MSKGKSKPTAIPISPKTARARPTRSERERAVDRAVLIASIALGAVIVVILGIALFIEGVIVPRQPVASVGNESISVADFQQRVRYERWRTGLELVPIAQSQFAREFLTNSQFGPYADMYRDLQIPTQIGRKVLDRMVEALIIEQYARENGISVSPEEVEKQRFTFYGYDPNPSTATPTLTPTLTLTPLISPTPTNTPTPTVEPTITVTPSPTPLPTGIPTATPDATQRAKTFQEDQTNFTSAARRVVGVDEAFINRLFAEAALRQKVITAVVGEPPKEQLQVKARHILLKTQAEAEEVLRALQNGESFAALAAALSQDPGSASQGGELDWTGRGVFVPQFEEAVFNAEIGAIIGPIDTSSNGPNFGFHIIQVQGREMRPLTDEQAKQAQERAFSQWLSEQRTARNAQTFALWIDVVPNTPTLAELGLPENIR
ncbi:MAG: peptidylprolyl isomerase [Anaerolineae bacterium]|nr:peptidylprolyl isomerase [Anaerolineae bacterium]MDW8298551.1 peptidylprolyl isomerase [Anaerolineae bacterium]